MSETSEADGGSARPARNPTRLYIILAAVLIVIIVVVSAVLVTKALPALKAGREPTAAAELSPTLAPTYTPGPTKAPTNTPLPPPSPTWAPVMLDTETPLFGFESAGARPSEEWTGFFGQVSNVQGEPLAGVAVVVWYSDGTLAEDVVRTDDSGSYEIRLAEAPLKGTWSIQLLTDDGQPASKLFSFNTDEDTQAGVQQIQVIWQELP